MRLLTNDIYEGAWLLSEGMELSNLWVSSNGKKAVVFEFHGAKVNLLQKDYQRGKAQANVLKLKSAMNELKDRMFWLLRNRQTLDPRSPIGVEDKLRGDKDREKENSYVRSQKTFQ